MINLIPIMDEVETAAVEAPSETPAPAKAKKPAKAKAPKGFKADSLGVLRAIGKGDFDAPAKALKAKAPKAEKPAKAKAEKPIAEPADQDSDPIEVFFVEFIGADTRDDNFMRALLRKAYDAGKAAPRMRTPRAGGPTKRELAAELLRRPEGCTSRDILDLTSWPAVSVPAVAKASGLTLRQEKQGRVTVYFGTPA